MPNITLATSAAVCASIILLATSAAYAETITARVVGIQDGDVITMPTAGDRLF